MSSKKNTAAQAAEETVFSFKGFDKNLQCRGFQFEIGKTFEHEGKVQACEGGFHACEYPLDVFGYYSPANSRFATTEQRGDISRHSDDSKIASRSIHIKAEIGIPALITAAFEFIKTRCEPASAEHATGDRSASSATGYRSSLTTGRESRSEILPDPDGKPLHAIAIAAGGESKARAPEGSAIVLCYRNDGGHLIHIRASKVGENGIKPDTWYSLDENGEFIESED